MATKPVNTPRWADQVPANIVEPASGQKDTGWIPGTKPPAQFFNWLFNLIYLWILYLQDLENQLFTWTLKHIFKGSVEIKETPGSTTPLTVNARTGSNQNAIEATAQGSGVGGSFAGGATNGIGVFGIGAGIAPGIMGQSAGTGDGGYFTAGANGRGVQGIGNGTGAGVKGTAGATNAPGIEGTGGGSGAGVKGTGGATGAGVTGTGGASGGAGVIGTGTDDMPGVQGTGGPTAGIFGGTGVIGTGNASANGIGVIGFGGGTGAGVIGTGGSGGGPGGAFSGGGGDVAVEIGTGNAKFTGTDPAKNVDPGANDYLCGANVCKAWGHIHIMPHNDGTATFTLEDGYNVESIEFTPLSVYKFRITFARPMANNKYAVIYGQHFRQDIPWVDNTQTTYFDMYIGENFNASAGDYDLTVNPSHTFYFAVFGRQ